MDVWLKRGAGKWGAGDLAARESFADSFAGWEPQAARQFSAPDITNLLTQLRDGKTDLEVIGVKEFPYSKGGALQGNECLIEREYWLELDTSDARLAGAEGLVVLHVHYAGKWHADWRKRDRSVIQQMNLRNTVKHEEARPGQNAYHKVSHLSTGDAWKELSGKPMFWIPPGGWRWQDQHGKGGFWDNKFALVMQRLLAVAEDCTERVRGMKKVELEVSPGARKALVVGVKKYEHPDVSNLPNAVADAECLKGTLEQLHWDVDDVYNPKLEEFKAAIYKFMSLLEHSQDACLFAFVGHGVQVLGEHFLLPADFTLQERYPTEHLLLRDVQSKAIAFSDIEAHLKAVRGEPTDKQVSLFVLDCCRNSISAVVGEKTRALSSPQRGGEAAQASTTVTNSFIIYSTTKGSTAGDGRVGRGGPFMNIFTQEMMSPVSIQDVMVRTRTKLLTEDCQLAPEQSTLTTTFSFCPITTAPAAAAEPTASCLSPLPFIFVGAVAELTADYIEEVTRGWKAYSTQPESTETAILGGNWYGGGGCGDTIMERMPSILHVEVRGDDESDSMLFNDAPVSFTKLRDALKYSESEGDQKRVRLAVVMASNSSREERAGALVPFADCVVGLDGELNEQSREFVKNLYAYLQKGKSVGHSWGKSSVKTRENHHMVLLPSRLGEVGSLTFDVCPAPVDEMCVALQNAALDESYYSGADTASMSGESDDEDSGHRAALFLYNPTGTLASYAEDVEKLFQSRQLSGMSLCGLLLFLLVDDGKQFGFHLGDPLQVWEAWKEKYKTAAASDQVLETSIFDGFEDAAERSGAVMDGARKEAIGCKKQHARCITVIDALVRNAIERDWGLEVDEWDRVLQDWFRTEEGSEALFSRASRFLTRVVRDECKLCGGRILLALEMQSCGVFMVLNRSSLSLLFALLQVERHVGSVTGEPRPAGGFSVAVASDRRAFNMRDGKLPPAGEGSVIVAGLRCMASMRDEDLEERLARYRSGQVESRDREAWPLQVALESSAGDLEAEEMQVGVEEVDSGRSAVREWTQPAEVPEKGGDHKHCSEKDSDDGHGAAGGDGGNQGKATKNPFEDEITSGLIGEYLGGLRTMINSYVDSASGETRKLDGESVALSLFSIESFEDRCDEDNRAVQEGLACPISHRLMHEPVKCSDGFTYERANIEKWFSLHATSPMTREALAHTLEAGEQRLAFASDEEAHDRVTAFRKQKDEEEERQMQEVEGEEEKRIILARYGHGLQEDGWEQAGDGLQIRSPSELVTQMAARRTGFACVIGPPASGKTVTVLQVVNAAASHFSSALQQKKGHLLLPVFLRASELSSMLSQQEWVFGTVSLKQLMKLFVAGGERSGLFPAGMVQVVDQLDLDHLFICIDGLDECGENREWIETVIDDAAKAAIRSDKPLHVLLSTREHTFSHSRKCFRLADFDVVRVQPLDKARQLDIVRSRIPSGKVDAFMQQLAVAATGNPELGASPFLLNLMIEVFRKDDELPTQRAKLYAKQVDGMVARCIAAHADDVSDLLVGSEATLLDLATDYLEAVAFVCQLRLERREFTVAAVAIEVLSVWQHDRELLAPLRELLFQPPTVGLVTCVRPDVFRFSHLTIQEYLAARCATRVYSSNIQGLLEQLQPLHSRWRIEVVKFITSMLGDEAFTAFCEAVLNTDDGAGDACELVRKFLKERGGPAEVGDLLREKLLQLRGVEQLVTGLCHVSQEMRDLVLSEMKQFQAPADPFSDGTCARLRTIAEDGSASWCKRTAAVLSLGQIANMDYCVGESSRTDTIRWLLSALKADLESDPPHIIRFGIISALGGVLSVDGDSSEQDCVVLAGEHESTILSALENEYRVAFFEVFDVLRVFSPALVDWLLDPSQLYVLAAWPARHVALMCKHITDVGDRERASQLAKQLFTQLCSPSLDGTMEGHLLECIDVLLTVTDGIDVALYLVTGDASQQARVLRNAATLGRSPTISGCFDKLSLDSGDAFPLVAAVLELNGALDVLVDWLAENGRPVIESVWPMSTVCLVSDKIAATRNKRHACVLANLLFQRVHSNSVILSEQTEIVEALRVLQGVHDAESNSMGAPMAPMIGLLETGPLAARLRVLQAAADSTFMVLDEPSLSRFAAGIDVALSLATGDASQQAWVLRNAATLGRSPTISGCFDKLSESLASVDAFPLVAAVLELNGALDVLVDWLAKNGRPVIESVWPMSTVCLVSDKIAATRNKRHACVLANLLFQRVHSSSDSVILWGQTEIVEALRVLQGVHDAESDSMGAPMAPMIGLLETGPLEARLRVLQTAADSTFMVLDEPSLSRFAQSLLLNVREDAEKANLQPHNFKSEVCNFWMSGTCRFGAKCQYAHGVKEVRKVICHHWQAGTCKFGKKCKFEHPAQAKKANAPTLTFIEYALSAKTRVDDCRSPSSSIPGFLLTLFASRRGQTFEKVLSLVAAHTPARAQEHVEPVADSPAASRNAATPAQHKIQVKSLKIERGQTGGERATELGIAHGGGGGGGDFIFGETETRGGGRETENGSGESQCRGKGQDTQAKEGKQAGAIDDGLVGPADGVDVHQHQSALKDTSPDRMTGHRADNFPRRDTAGTGNEVSSLAARAGSGSWSQNCMLNEGLQLEVLRSPTKDNPSLTQPRSISPHIQDLEMILGRTMSAAMLNSGLLGSNDRDVGSSSSKCICTQLWLQSGLVSDTFAQDMGVTLPTECTELDLETFLEGGAPLLSRGCTPSEKSWVDEVIDLINAGATGRFVFGIILQYIQRRFRADPVSASSDLQCLSDRIQAWPAKAEDQQLERQFLLKEFRIGRSALAIPTWCSPVFLPNAAIVEAAVRLHLKRGYVIKKIRMDTVDLSRFDSLLELPGDLHGFAHRIRHLHLSCSLNQLPEWMGHMGALCTLNLSRCGSLAELPSTMGGLTGLQTLDLSGCKGLTELPSTMGGLTGLQTLDLHGCSGLTELPSTMGGLTGMQTLKLFGCSGLTELPWMGGMTGLQTLNLSWCSGLTELPSWMGGLTGLQTLHLWGCSGLTELPSWMGGLTGLQTLDLSECSGLRELPSWMGGMTGLQTLNLSWCSGLTELPSTMGGLTGLQTLNLWQCCSGLKERPSWMGGLTGLRVQNFHIQAPPPKFHIQGSGDGRTWQAGWVKESR